MNSTVSDVSIKEDICYETIRGTIQRHISDAVNWDKIERLNVIGLDEISLKKGHKDFVVIVTSRDCDNITILVSCQPYNVAKNITHVLHNQSEMIEYEEIHCDTCQRGTRSS